MRWLFLSPVVVAAIPMCVASLRGNWWLAAVPYGLFSWSFATVVLADSERSGRQPLHVVWTLSFVLLLSSMARYPRPGSWWWDRFRSWRGRWMTVPGPVVGLLFAIWIVAAPVPLVGLLVTLALVGAVAMFLAAGVGALIMAIVRRDARRAQVAIMAWGAALPMVSVILVYVGRGFVFES